MIDLLLSEYRSLHEMGSQQSVMVANAFPQEIYVRARTERITEQKATTIHSGKVKLPAPQKLQLEGSYEVQSRNEGKTAYDVLIEAGFCKMPKAAVSKSTTGCSVK